VHDAPSMSKLTSSSVPTPHTESCTRLSQHTFPSPFLAAPPPPPQHTPGRSSALTAASALLGSLLA